MPGYKYALSNIVADFEDSRMNPKLENTASKDWPGPRKIKKPFKLVLETIFLVLLTIPYVLWAGVTDIVAKKKSLKDNVVLVSYLISLSAIDFVKGS